MAGSFTDFVENKVLDHLFGTNTTVLSTGKFGSLYVGLYAAGLSDTMTALTTGECAGSTYNRKSFTNSTANWANTTGGIKRLKTAITVTTAAGSDWGTIIGFAILDSTSTAAGNALVYSTLTGGSKVINTGDTVTVTTGFTITLT